MKEETLKRYREWRLKHPTTPPRCFDLHPKPPPFEWEEEVERGNWIKVARYQDDRFRYVAKYVYDDAPHEPIEYLGEFTDDEGDDTLKRRNAGYRECKRFRLATTVAQRQKYRNEVGMAKGPAYEEAVREAHQDLARAEDFGNGWWMGGVVVTAYLLADEEHEDEMGRASIWGIESDCGDDYLTDCAQDFTGEARRDALGHLERLCRRMGQGHFEFFAGGP